MDQKWLFVFHSSSGDVPLKVTSCYPFKVCQGSPSQLQTFKPEFGINLSRAQAYLFHNTFIAD